MSHSQAKLIIIRGNSGSGKSAVAKRIREAGSGKIALIGQDYLRRTVLKEKETEGSNNHDLIEQTVLFCLSRGYHVILEGILYFPRYEAMLRRLIEHCPNYYVYYLDISFPETLRRHATKPNAHEFGEKEMRGWYKPRDLTGFKGEKIIPESSSLDATVQTILTDTQL